ncbi:MAG: hypothetical protein J6C27_02645 [Clostridia bacterium]|nr:hypothetical protein [Clostridia bacterium]
MKKAIKVLAFILVMCMTFSIVGCNNDTTPNKKQGVTVSTMKEINGRQVVYHKGSPFFFNAMHLRYDHLVTNLDSAADKALADGMRLIKENGFETVIIYVNWGKIYDGEKYDLTWFTKQFKEAEKNDLKVLINWFGSNVCGFGGYMSWQKDYEKYPSLMDDYGRPVVGTGFADGKRIPDFSQPIFFEEESQALRLICDWLYENDKDRRTVALQICDEPNNNEGGYGQWMSQFVNYANYMEKLAEVVKTSKYSMVTYTVLMSAGYNDEIEGYSFDERLKYLVDLPNLDFVGYSIYAPDTTPRFKSLEQEGNFPVWIGLNPSSWVTPGQALYSIANGYGYCYYQFVNYGEGDGGYYSYTNDKKVGDTVYGSRDGTADLLMGQFAGHLEVDHKEIVNMNKSIFAMDELIATNREKMMVCFNNNCKNDFSGKKNLDDEKIHMTYKDTSKKYGPAGFMLKAADGNFYGFATRDSSFTFTSDITVTEGHYEGDKWISEGDVEVKDKSFTAFAGKTYQVVTK